MDREVNYHFAWKCPIVISSLILDVVERFRPHGCPAEYIVGIDLDRNNSCQFCHTPSGPQTFEVTAVPCPSGSSKALVVPATNIHLLFGTVL